MPRKKGSNVINFPTTAQKERQEELVEKARKGGETVIALIDKNRKAGLKALEKKCDDFDHREMVTPDNPISENTLRDIEGALRASLTVLEATNSLADMIRHDLINAIKNIEQQAMAGWQSSTHLQTLLQTLKEKGILSDEELKATWDKLIKKQTQEIRQAQQGESKPEPVKQPE